MQITLDQADVASAWMVLTSTTVPRNRFDLHQDIMRALEPSVTDIKGGVATVPYEGDALEAKHVEFLAELAGQVEQLPGSLVKTFAAFEAKLAALAPSE